MALPFLLLCGCSQPAPPADPVFSATQPDLLGAPGTLTNAWADFDSDGELDLFVGFNGEPNRLYRNAQGELVDVAAEVGIADARGTRTSAWGDYDSDGNGRKTRAGAEVRVYQAGTRTLLGTRLLDTGSGYDTQSSLPVHFGLLTGASVDIEVIFPGGGNRTVTALRNIDPRDQVGWPITVILPG